MAEKVEILLELPEKQREFNNLGSLEMAIKASILILNQNLEQFSTIMQEIETQRMEVLTLLKKHLNTKLAIQVLQGLISSRDTLIKSQKEQLNLLSQFLTRYKELDKENLSPEMTLNNFSKLSEKIDNSKKWLVPVLSTPVDQIAPLE